ncbi:hypothetical protein JW998_04695 [candidate division KSB1 bacterium]|nr:hypothetical protein [candidate division KSB1 bacterium]
MSSRLLTFFVVLLFCSRNAAAHENGLLLQLQAGLAQPLSPAFITAYWTNSISFGAAFGTAVSERSVILLSYSHFTFDYDASIIPEDDHAFAHQVLLACKRWMKTRCAQLLPFYQFGAGITLLRSPNIYQESPQFPGYIDRENILEPAHQNDGLTIHGGVGVNYRFLNETTLTFVEIFSSTSFSPSIYSTIGGRCGVLFKI